MRPDEWDRTDAQRWVTVVGMVSAYQAGEQDAASEAKAKASIDEMWKRAEHA